MMNKNSEHVDHPFKRLLREPKTDELPYDDPTRFGEALAQRHAQILDEALIKWSNAAVRRAKSKSARKTKARQSADVPHPG